MTVIRISPCYLILFHAAYHDSLRIQCLILTYFLCCLMWEHDSLSHLEILFRDLPNLMGMVKLQFYFFFFLLSGKCFITHIPHSHTHIIYTPIPLYILIYTVRLYLKYTLYLNYIWVIHSGYIIQFLCTKSNIPK